MTIKYETEFIFENVKIMIFDSTSEAYLNYTGDIQKIKFNLYNFASIFKQTVSLSRVEFKYHSLE